MTIENYKAKDNVEILEKLFLVGDVIYVTPSFHVMNGVFDYARKVFDGDKNYLGMIRASKFPESSLERWKNER